MEVERGQKQLVPSNGVKDSRDIDADGKEGDADGYSGDSNFHNDKDNDNKDEEEEEGEVGKWARQVETSTRGHITHRVEQGPWTPLERTAHE